MPHTPQYTATQPQGEFDLARRIDAARRTGCADTDDELAAARGICLGILVAVPVWLVAIVVTAWWLE